mmetsp:Transcript_117722/g.375220  ORF Transcript_117722/g.375220 Transcript_117722/m.375220 type:complete len:204 (+) Transcript_117722:2869-3480(+)
MLVALQRQPGGQGVPLHAVHALVVRELCMGDKSYGLPRSFRLRAREVEVEHLIGQGAVEGQVLVADLQGLFVPLLVIQRVHQLGICRRHARFVVISDSFQSKLIFYAETGQFLLAVAGEARHVLVGQALRRAIRTRALRAMLCPLNGSQRIAALLDPAVQRGESPVALLLRVPEHAPGRPHDISPLQARHGGQQGGFCAPDLW